MNPKELQTLKQLVYLAIQVEFDSAKSAEDPFAVIAKLNELSEIYYKLPKLSTLKNDG